MEKKYYLKGTKIFLRRVMLIIILLPILLFSSQQPTSRQIDEKIRQSIIGINSSKTSQDYALKIIMQCYEDSKEIGYEKGVFTSGLYAIIAYSNKYDYESSIKISNEIEGLVGKYATEEKSVDFYANRAKCLSILGLYKKAYREYIRTITMANRISDKDTKYYYLSMVNLEFAYHYLNQDKNDSTNYYMEMANNFAKKILPQGKLDKNGKRRKWLLTLYSSMGDYYLYQNPNNINLARKYFVKTKDIYENHKIGLDYIQDALILSQLCNFYFDDRNYEESIKYGLKSLELQKKDKFPLIAQSVYQNIAKSYQKIGEQDQYQKYITKYSAISDSLRNLERGKTSATVESLMAKQQKDNENIRAQIIYITVAAVCIILIVFLFLRRRTNRKLHSNYLLIIKNINSEIPKKPISKEVLGRSSFSIHEETYKKIMNKFEKFEKNLGFLRKDLTLSYLSNQFKTNPKSLSLIIKENTGKNFTTYINDLRIDYITKKLYEEPIYREFKIDYLAEECGYASSNVFASAFKKVTGVTPAYFIQNLKKDKTK